jgi:hypothetical protein
MQGWLFAAVKKMNMASDWRNCRLGIPKSAMGFGRLFAGRALQDEEIARWV